MRTILTLVVLAFGGFAAANDEPYADVAPVADVEPTAVVDPVPMAETNPKRDPYQEFVDGVRAGTTPGRDGLKSRLKVGENPAGDHLIGVILNTGHVVRVGDEFDCYVNKDGAEVMEVVAQRPLKKLWEAVTPPYCPPGQA